MAYKVTIGPRGTFTIPAKLRKAYSLQTNDQLIIEETGEGLLLKPAVSIPIEMYSEERIAEFASDEIKLAKLFKEQSR